MTETRKRYRALIAPESAELKACLQFLRSHPKVAWAARINSGAYKDKERYIRYGFPGCSDIIGQLKSGRLLAFECKSRGKKPTKLQHDFIAKVHQYRGLVGWGTIDDCIWMLNHSGN